MLKKVYVRLSFILSASIVMSMFLCNFKVDAATKTITSTIVVKAGETYDGKGDTIVAVGLGDGGQGESQKPIFKLEKGAKLRNVRIAFPGCDGVHCYGDNVVENVVWEDIGEDALTVKGEGTVEIIGGSARDGEDKCFQINAAGVFKVTNFSATNVGKLIRQNGDTTFKTTIYLDNVTLNGADECVARTDSTTTQLYYSNCKFTNVPKLWVFPSLSQVHETSSVQVTPTPVRTPIPTQVPTPIPTLIIPSGANSGTYQAENASISKAVIETKNSGYTGASYINFDNELGGYIEWVVNIINADSYNLVFNYANGTTSNRSMDISVNGSVKASNESFTGTDSWTDWKTKTVVVNLQAGVNRIRITSTSSDGGPNIDKLDLYSSSGGVQATPTPIPTLSNCGDLNGDGTANSTDYALMKRYILGITVLTNEQLECADLNLDKQINSTDYAVLRRYILNMIETLPYTSR